MKRFKEARLNKKLKISDVAKALGVTSPTVSSWENERKSPTVDMLIKIAELYGVTTDYLLGLDVPTALTPNRELDVNILSVYDTKPVWVHKHGWALVNAADNLLVFSNGAHIRFSEAPKTVLIPDCFCETDITVTHPIGFDRLRMYDTVWLEPISKDPEIRTLLRGRYAIKNGFAENESGNRFPLSSYGATWWAFEIKD